MMQLYFDRWVYELRHALRRICIRSSFRGFVPVLAAQTVQADHHCGVRRTKAVLRSTLTAGRVAASGASYALPLYGAAEAGTSVTGRRVVQ